MKIILRIETLLIPIFIIFFQPSPEILAKIKPSANIFADYSSPLEHIEQDFDVLRYDVELDLRGAAESGALTGKCEITMTWRAGAEDNVFYFNLRGLSVDSAFFDGEKVEPVEVGAPSSATYHYEIDRTGADIPDTSRAVIYYGGKFTIVPVEHGFTWGGVHNDGGMVYSLGVGFYNDYVSATRHWFPCYDHPSDKAEFSGKFITGGETVASVGLSEHYEEDGAHVWRWTHDFPCATYLLTFALYDYEKIDLTQSDVPIHIYCSAEDTTKTKYAMKLVPDMLEIFEEIYGEYPFDKVGYVVTPRGSMEHQTMISFSEHVVDVHYSNRDSINWTAAHELSHMWFGDLVSPADFRDAWLNEAFATFSESVWIENYSGWDAYLKKLEGDINGFFTRGAPEKVPLYDFSREYPSSNYPSTIYYKGSAVVAMLRYEMGDSLFFGAINEYLRENAYKNATTESLQKTLEDYSGMDLEQFFRRWVYDLGYPVLTVDIDKRENGGSASAEITMKQTQPKMYGMFYDLPVEITFRAADGASESRVFRMTQPEQKFLAEGLAPFDNVIVNRGPSLRTLMMVTDLNITSVAPCKDAAPTIKIYPNPSGGTLKAEITGATGAQNLRIVDLFGKEIFRGEYVFSGSDTVSIQLDAAAGHYFLILKQNGNIVRKRFLLNP